MYHRNHINDASDHIYYNAQIFNPNSNTQQINAEYSETRNDPLISSHDISNYACTVTRFNVPLSSIPIFTFREGAYSVTLVFGAQVVQVPLIFTNRTPNGPDFGVYHFQHMLDMINTALATAMAGLVGVTNTDPPFMIYDASTNLFSVLITEDFLDTDDIDIFMNWQLFSLFQTLNAQVNGYSEPDGRDVLIFTIGTESLEFPGYYITTQELQALYLWYDLEKVIFKTSGIPILQTEVSNANENGETRKDQILIDRNLNILGLTDSLTDVIYFPTGPYKLMDLKKGVDLRKLDFRVFWQNKAGEQFPLMIDPGQTVDIKMLFIRK
jgi:hypothetical protein